MRAFRVPRDPALLTVDEAVATILAQVRPIATETISLPEALGRVLREDVIAPYDLPATDNSAMDGYAVRASDTDGAPVRLEVRGDLAAGGSSGTRVEPATALRIMTGAPLPPGADAIAPVEITDGGSAFVTVERTVRSGANVRRRGEDMKAGDLVVAAGSRLGAGELAVLAAARVVRPVVAMRPNVNIIATGDELASIDDAAAPDRIVDSNSYALEALAREAGAVARRAPAARDTLDATIAAIEAALDADFIVTTGGVSVGAYDFVKEALERLGARTHFWRVAMRPGKPVLFATLRDRLVFGLPGNPVSSMVAFTIFVAPAIRAALGQTFGQTAPIVRMKTSVRMKGADDRRAYLRVRVVARGGELVAEPMRSQGSHIATSMVGANGLAIVEAGTGDVEAGDIVPVMLIGPVSGPST